MTNRLTTADIVLLVVLTAFTIGSFFTRDLLASQGFTVVVELRNVAVYKGNLNEERQVTVRGGFGDVRISIHNGCVAVVHAECPNKVCVRTGWRNLAGESIICVPNRLVIRILGDMPNVVRGITG
ncbi:MAG: hypothetical protein C4326_05240 [Ignavibacteria bacterium]